MIRRCPAPLTMMVVALAISLGSQPMSTQADTLSTATYTLTSPDGLPVPAPISRGRRSRHSFRLTEASFLPRPSTA